MSKLEQTAVDSAGLFFQGRYLEYINDYLTVRAFAMDKGITEEEAIRQIAIGSKIHDELTARPVKHS